MSEERSKTGGQGSSFRNFARKILPLRAVVFEQFRKLFLTETKKTQSLIEEQQAAIALLKRESVQNEDMLREIQEELRLLREELAAARQMN